MRFAARIADLTPEKLEPLYYRDALDWIRQHPARWIRLEGRKLFYTVVPIGPSYSATLAEVLCRVGDPVLSRCSVPQRRVPGSSGVEDAPPMALWLMALSTVIAGLVFFPQERFRIPVIDPALIVTAAALAGCEGTCNVHC